MFGLLDSLSKYVSTWDGNGQKPSEVFLEIFSHGAGTWVFFLPEVTLKRGLLTKNRLDSDKNALVYKLRPAAIVDSNPRSMRRNLEEIYNNSI